MRLCSRATSTVLLRKYFLQIYKSKEPSVNPTAPCFVCFKRYPRFSEPGAGGAWDKENKSETSRIQ